MARKSEAQDQIAAATMPGCYGDGCGGHTWTRTTCAGVIRGVIMHYVSAAEPFAAAARGADIATELDGEMSDDAQEEYDACDWLNEHAPFDGHVWEWRDGDFGLWPDEGE